VFVSRYSEKLQHVVSCWRLFGVPAVRPLREPAVHQHPPREAGEQVRSSRSNVAPPRAKNNMSFGVLVGPTLPGGDQHPGQVPRRRVGGNGLCDLHLHIMKSPSGSFRYLLGRHGERLGHHLSGEDFMVRFANSIFTLCRPGGSPTVTTVLLSLASAHHQGRSSTVMCRCPTRVYTSRASGPNTCTMRRFSTRYWAQ
jgi:hypothetical protein